MWIFSTSPPVSPSPYEAEVIIGAVLSFSLFVLSNICVGIVPIGGDRGTIGRTFEIEFSLTI
jgi:hypothetical protein